MHEKIIWKLFIYYILLYIYNICVVNNTLFIYFNCIRSINLYILCSFIFLYLVSSLSKFERPKQKKKRKLLRIFFENKRVPASFFFFLCWRFRPRWFGHCMRYQCILRNIHRYQWNRHRHHGWSTQYLHQYQFVQTWQLLRHFQFESCRKLHL